MKKFLFILMAGCLYTCPGIGDSLLKPTAFPKTFQDVPFETRIEILRQGYMPYKIEYDENGICISNCAYRGITIKDDMDSVTEATNEMVDLIQQSEYVASSGQDWCQNGKTTKLPLRYPVDMTNVKYKITSDFGFRTNSPNGSTFHPAVDIGCPSGTPVYATADGVVVTVDNESVLGGAGNYINIKHDNGLITQYLHLDTVLVSIGDTVRACQQIAQSGNSGKDKNGNDYVPHLDYRIRFDSNKNKYVDILCPCKTSDRNTQNSYETNLNMNCAHSLFNAPYKFKNSNIKHSKWRVDHGHCMQNQNSLLPDEIAQ